MVGRAMRLLLLGLLIAALVSGQGEEANDDQTESLAASDDQFDTLAASDDQFDTLAAPQGTPIAVPYSTPAASMDKEYGSEYGDDYMYTGEEDMSSLGTDGSDLTAGSSSGTGTAGTTTTPAADTTTLPAGTTNVNPSTTYTDDATQMAGEEGAPAAEEPPAAGPEEVATPVATPAPSRPFDLKLTSFQCDVQEIDVKAADKTMSCTAIVQASEGLARVSGAFYNPPMNKWILIKIEASDLYQGDVYGGSFVGDVVIPKGSDQATWSLGFVDTGAFYALEVLDQAGNSKVYTKSEATTFFQNLQLKLQISSYTGDLLAYPQANVVASSGNDVKSIACLDVSVKVLTADKELTCTATVLPDESGVGTVLAYFVSPTNQTVIPLIFKQNALTQFLTAKNGEQVATLTTKISISQYAETGTYSLAFSGPHRLTTISHAGTIKTFEASQLASNPTIQVVAKGDTVAPLVTKFACQAGQQVQLTNKGSVPLTCQLKGYDDQAGVSYLAIQFVSPSRTQALEFSYVPDSPGLGDWPNPTVAQVAVSQTASLTNATEPGPWTMVRAIGADMAGNYKVYSSEDLDAKNVQAFFLVQGVTQKFSIAPKAGEEEAPVKTVSPASRPSLSMAVALGAGLAMAWATWSASGF